MAIIQENEHTHIVYVVEKKDEVTLTKIGIALVNKQVGCILDVNTNYLKGDILLYKKITSIEG